MHEHVDCHIHVNHVFQIFPDIYDKKPLRADGKPSELILVFKKIRSFEKIHNNGYSGAVLVIFRTNFTKIKSQS